MKKSVGEKIFITVNYTLLTIIALITIYPFLYVVVASISSSDAVTTGKVIFWPKDLTFVSYKRVFGESSIWRGYANTVYYTIVGTAVNLFITICGAYPLSKKELPGRKAFTLMAVITMWLNAGMIPFFLNLRDLHLLDTRLALIIAFGCSTFNMILLRTFFESVPESLEEASKVDGATDFQVLMKVYLPLSKPALATVGLFYAMERWNGFFWAMIIFKDDKKVPLQVVLRKLIIEVNMVSENMDFSSGMSIETFIYATIVISVIPMIVLYPFIQKHFTKGIMVGAVKG